MQADDLRLLGIPRSRLIIAIIYPHHVAHSKITQTFRSRKVKARCMQQCSARAAQNIEGHHRPVIASNFLRLHTESPSKKFNVNPLQKLTLYQVFQLNKEKEMEKKNTR